MVANPYQSPKTIAQSEKKRQGGSAWSRGTNAGCWSWFSVLVFTIFVYEPFFSDYGAIHAVLAFLVGPSAALWSLFGIADPPYLIGLHLLGGILFHVMFWTVLFTARHRLGATREPG